MKNENSKSFYNAIYKYYDEIFPVKDVKVDFVKSYLNGENKKILDIGCANGKFLSQFRGARHHLYGIDLNEKLIADAKSSFSDIYFKTYDMRLINNLFLTERFDVILCTGNTLAHLSQDDVKQFIRDVHTLLLPGGVFIIQLVNFSKMIGTLPYTFPAIDTEHVLFERTYLAKKGENILFQGHLTEKKSQHTSIETTLLFPIDSTLLKIIMKEIDYKKINFYGNFKKVIYTINSGALVVVGERG